MDKEYSKLLETYSRMFGMVNAFHFNSKNTAKVYEKYMDVPVASKVIPITHGGIKDHRKQRVFNNLFLRLGFIGNETPYKGLPILKDVISRLNQKEYTHSFSLYVYGGRTGADELLSNVLYKGRFTSAMIEQVYDDMDILVVPSIWNETFSLVTIEALSYGVPVLVSDKVGAKDIVRMYDASFVYQTKEELYDKIKCLLKDKTALYEYNKKILSSPWKHDVSSHAQDIIDNVYK